ncbi:ClbS/DfsB family four-helix bundle protein [Corynebacterium caspium]|uniref:ClbS/DfsB family four-helix bundle protein n=1 Tax=Corynebacterium caspium TaxID=234828 RepID=UPI000477C529|nr:ClbS/DfsB family four-helix bundle protein [Corynebacterium caspium]
MARPQSKDELLAAANTQFDKLLQLLESIPTKDREADFPQSFANQGTEAHWQRDKNCRDVLIHLYEWQQLWLNWVHANLAGEKRPFLLPPYTWKNYAGMNEVFKAKHQNTSYHEAIELLQAAHEEILGEIQALNNEELFTKKYFPFTGSTSLGSYTVSATSSHYEWAIKKIRKYKKSL